MNPLTAIPPKARLYVYALLTLAALGLSAYKATEGDWVEFAATLLASLGFGTAASNTPVQQQRILGNAFTGGTFSADAEDRRNR